MADRAERDTRDREVTVDEDSVTDWLWPRNPNQIIDKLVAEGKQVGKAPWCCSSLVEDAAARRLLYGHGIEGRETMDETIARRAKHDKRYRAVQLRIEQEKHGS